MFWVGDFARLDGVLRRQALGQWDCWGEYSILSRLLLELGLKVLRTRGDAGTLEVHGRGPQGRPSPHHL